jgi:hypothetical protein
MKTYLSLIHQLPRGPRNDVTPLFADPTAFASLVEDLVVPFDLTNSSHVASTAMGSWAPMSQKPGMVGILAT